jgi:hypothetical protein
VTKKRPVAARKRPAGSRNGLLEVSKRPLVAKGRFLETDGRFLVTKEPLLCAPACFLAARPRLHETSKALLAP